MSEKEVKKWWERQFIPLSVRADLKPLDTRGEQARGGWWQAIPAKEYKAIDSLLNNPGDDLILDQLKMNVLMGYGLFFEPRNREIAMLRAKIMEEEAIRCPRGPYMFNFAYQEYWDGEDDEGIPKDMYLIDFRNDGYYDPKWTKMITVANRPNDISVPTYIKLINSYTQLVNRRLERMHEPKMPMFPQFGY